MSPFSKFFSSGSGSKKQRPKTKSLSTAVGTYGGLSDGQIKAVMQSDADRQLYEYSKPKQQRGLTDLIASHNPGDDFPYASIVGKDHEDFTTKVQRLLRLQPSVTRKEIPGLKSLTLPLIKDMEKVDLSTVIPVKGLPYLYLGKATAHFTPMSSFLDGFSECRFSLIDTRMLNNQERQVVLSGTNLQTPMEFCMDHCIPRTSAAKIQLCISRTQPNMIMGEQWGFVEIILELEESDKPFIENTRDVAAAAQLPTTGMETYTRDPNFLNIQLHENHRPKLQELYQAGKILDATQPALMRVAKAKYAKSSAPGQSTPKPSLKAQPSDQGDMKPDVGNWDMVKRSQMPVIPDDQVSYSVEDDGLDDTISISPRRSLSSDNGIEDDVPEPSALAEKVLSAESVRNSPSVTTDTKMKGKKTVGWDLSGV